MKMLLINITCYAIIHKHDNKRQIMIKTDSMYKFLTERNGIS